MKISNEDRMKETDFLWQLLRLSSKIGVKMSKYETTKVESQVIE